MPQRKRLRTTKAKGPTSCAVYVGKIFSSFNVNLSENEKRARLSALACLTLKDMMDSIIERVAKECKSLLDKEKKQNLKSGTVRAAVRLCFSGINFHYSPHSATVSPQDSPAELYAAIDNRMAEIQTAIAEFTTKTTTVKMEDDAIAAASLSNATRVHMPMERVRRKYKHYTGQSAKKSVSIARNSLLLIAGVAEFIMRRVIEVSLSLRNKEITVMPATINAAIASDTELTSIFGGATISYGGVMPTAHTQSK